jgi:polar amino acid transport system substrate-binding protein
MMAHRKGPGRLGMVLGAAALLAWNGPPANAEGEIRVLTFDVPPFSSEAGAGSERPGIYVEIMTAVLADLGIQAAIEFVGNAEGQEIAQSRPDTVFFPIARTAEREDRYHWLDMVFSQQLGFVTLAERGAIESLEEARELERIGAIEGSSALRFIEGEGFTNLVVGPAEELVRMLVGGEIDAWFSGFLILRDIVQRQGFEAEFAFGYAPIEGQPYFAVGREVAKIDVEQWRASFARLREQGRFDRLHARYFGD